MKEPNLIIISPGTANGTKVLMPDGTEINGVISVEVAPVEPQGVVVATIKVRHVALGLPMSLSATPAIGADAPKAA